MYDNFMNWRATGWKPTKGLTADQQKSSDLFKVIGRDAFRTQGAKIAKEVLGKLPHDDYHDLYASVSGDSRLAFEREWSMRHPQNANENDANTDNSDDDSSSHDSDNDNASTSSLGVLSVASVDVNVQSPHIGRDKRNHKKKDDSITDMMEKVSISNFRKQKDSLRAPMILQFLNMGICLVRMELTGNTADIDSHRFSFSDDGMYLYRESKVPAEKKCAKRLIKPLELNPDLDADVMVINDAINEKYRKFNTDGKDCAEIDIWHRSNVIKLPFPVEKKFLGRDLEER